ncbi:putative GNAT family N-acyltransferase [Kurthia huakuii]|uniref:GNAT family N-acetyltransferase n=1 Tax=Kurthia huakuii TaxID=1421019 RepID=UPI000688096E|nr:GNAT family N-acetyltransferase [Kurthia huakuii]MBM7698510.1 putative GNAT family N-acyltransferase [Kurthia huakuii]
MKRIAYEVSNLQDVVVKIAQSEQEKQDAFFVRKEVFVKEQGLPLPLEVDDLDKIATHIVAYYKQQPIAASRIIVNDKSDSVKVERLSVLPKFRRKQIGIQMMQTIEAFIRKNFPNVSVIKIHAQIHAIPFYEKQGFSVTSPEFMDNYIPHRAIEKHI